MNKPFAVTLFSGLGSSSKALRDLGYDVIPHDFMTEAVATLKANGFERATHANVKDIDYSNYPEVDVLAGGPPCQPFSQSHQGAGRYDERDMIPEFLRAVAELAPKLFVMEEVQTLTWAKHADYLAMVEDHMRTLGYVVEHRILDASKFGLAQKRKRLFVVGVRVDVAESQTRQDVLGGPIAWASQDETPVTLADALGWDLGDAYEANQKCPKPGGDYSWVFTRPAVTVVGSFRADVQAAPGYRVKGDPPRQNTPGSVSLTLEERLVLQDMPTNWVVTGSASKRDLQVGNSVPCGLIRELIDLNIA